MYFSIASFIASARIVAALDRRPWTMTADRRSPAGATTRLETRDARRDAFGDADARNGATVIMAEAIWCVWERRLKLARDVGVRARGRVTRKRQLGESQISSRSIGEKRRSVEESIASTRNKICSETDS